MVGLVMTNKMKEEMKQFIALSLGFIVCIMSFVLSLERNPETGAIRINFGIIFLGIVVAILIYLGSILIGKDTRKRFCVKWESSIY